MKRARRDIGAERPRPDIAGAGIGADQVGLGGAADREAAGLDRREAEMPIRAQKAQARLGRAPLLDRDRQGQIPSPETAWLQTKLLQRHLMMSDIFSLTSRISWQMPRSRLTLRMARFVYKGSII